ncbi:MAG: heavy metal translocating P-type ATPase [Clostridium sp.]
MSEGRENIKLILDGLHCAGCASKIETLVNELEGVEGNLNFTTKELSVFYIGNRDKVIDSIKKIVKDLEPDVVVSLRDENKSPLLTSSRVSFMEEIKKPKNIKAIIGIGFFIAAMLYSGVKYLEIGLFIVAYLLIGQDVLLKAVNNIFKGRIFDENFLMTIATLGAFAIGEYPEAVAVMLFYKVGEAAQDMAVSKSRNSIASLMDIRPDYANLLSAGIEKKVDPYKVKVNDIIIVKPGEKIPLDGVVVEGFSSVDTTALTGESMLRDVEDGDKVLSGFINKSGLIKVRVEKEFKSSTVAKILDLVENASNKKAKAENFITKFAKYYTPAVVFIAAFIALGVPTIMSADYETWIYRGLIFLVVSCPCALVISIPLSYFGGIGGASKKGILVKGSNYLDALKDIDTIVFDKTGTLTKGVFKVTDIVPHNGFDTDEILRLCAYAESNSNHPISKSIVEYFGHFIDKNIVENYTEISGKGVSCTVKGRKLLVGNRKLLDDNNIPVGEIDVLGTVVLIGIDNKFAGYILISDELKDDTISALKDIKSLGIKETIMLTGDNKKAADKIASSIGIDKVYSELLPQDKVEKFESICSGKKAAFVGDGINDAPVLARADVGIAMGGLGSDAAIEAADIVIMTDEISKVAEAIKISRLTSSIVMQNIALALSVKALVLVLGTIGMATMWEAVFADVGVTLLAVLNSMRVLKGK